MSCSHELELVAESSRICMRWAMKARFTVEQAEEGKPLSVYILEMGEEDHVQRSIDTGLVGLPEPLDLEVDDALQRQGSLSSAPPPCPSPDS